MADRTGPARRAGERPPIEGVLVVDKPRGLTSHDVVARVRRALGERRVGHAGTLDPMATGVLVVLVGEGTKLAPYLTAADKRYTARVTFGAATATLDAEGEVVARAEVPAALRAELRAIEADPRAALDGRLAAALRAEAERTSQVPPAFSAIQIGGERSHELARAGKAVALEPRPVAVRALRVLSASEGAPDGSAGPAPAGASASEGAAPAESASASEGAAPAESASASEGAALAESAGAGAGAASVDLDVLVSKGYYVRSLARDLGERLGVPAHLSALRRTASGAFTLAEAAPLDAGAERLREALAPLAEAVKRALPAARLTEEGARRARQGKRLSAADFEEGAAPPAAGPAAWLDGAGRLTAMGEAVGEGEFAVLRGFREA